MKLRCPNCKTIQLAPAQFCKGCGGKFDTIPAVSEQITIVSKQTKNSLVIILFLAVFIFVAAMLQNTSSLSENTSTSPRQTTVSQTTPDQKNDFHRQSLSVVGADDGWQLPDNGDIRVKRAEFLLKNISEKTSESPFDIAYATDTMSNLLEEKFGKKIKRLQLLEEMQDVYADGRAEKYGKKYSDVLGIYALAKYGN